MSCILILDDGRKGHLNQSIAFAEHLGAPYDVVSVRPRHRWSKALSYLLDRFGICTEALFSLSKPLRKHYAMVVGAGSGTYYMTKVLAKRLGARSVTMMLPKGYRYDFDTIFAPIHDNPPERANIVPIPANFAYIEPQGLFYPQKPAIAIVIGGPNGTFAMDETVLLKRIEKIIAHFKGYEIALSTSPRTPVTIEKHLEALDIEYKVIYSQHPVNPIPDFLTHCETLFVTIDSTSMISEAVSYGNAAVTVLPLPAKGDNKYMRFVERLAKEGYVHLCDGTFKRANRKIDFSRYAQKAVRV